MNKLIVLDIANLQFRAIFNHLAQRDGELIKLLCTILLNRGLDTNIASLKQEYNKDKNIFRENYSDELVLAERILEQKIRERKIYLPAPTYTFMNMITGYFNKFKIDLDDMIIMAQDFSSWRKEEEKKYKAQRDEYRQKQEKQEWWLGQYEEFNSLYKKLNYALPYYWIKIWLVEADDIASVCCRRYKDKEIYLVSSDADWEQLAFFTNVKIFSPITKKFKEIKNPTKILLNKITKGDKSDNLTEKVSNELEFEHRKKLVDLITPLPDKIEQSINNELNKIMPKNMMIDKVPFQSIRKKLIKLYQLS